MVLTLQTPVVCKKTFQNNPYFKHYLCNERKTKNNVEICISWENVRCKVSNNNTIPSYL